jgi:hypothetical protein
MNTNIAYKILHITFAGLLITGCASSDVNPTQPNVANGYADIYAEPAGEIYWHVDRASDSNSSFRAIYSKLELPSRGILRLELPPGTQRLRITIQNLAQEKPLEVAVPIAAAKITPIEVRRAPTRESYVRDVEDRTRHGGRRRVVTDKPNQLYELSSTVHDSVPYEPKEKMSYAR